MKARLCLMVAGLLAAGACASDDSGSTGGPDSTPSIQTTATPTTTAGQPSTAPPTTTAEPSTTSTDVPVGSSTWGEVEVSTEAGSCPTSDGDELAPTLMVVDRASGELVWQMCHDGVGLGHAAVDAGGAVVYLGSVASVDGTTTGLIGLDSTTGEVV